MKDNRNIIVRFDEEGSKELNILIKKFKSNLDSKGLAVSFISLRSEIVRSIVHTYIKNNKNEPTVEGI